MACFRMHSSVKLHGEMLGKQLELTEDVFQE